MNIRPFFYQWLIFLALLVVHTDASAEDVCDFAQRECVEMGKWDFSIGIGVGVRTNPVVQNDNIPIILTPAISYYGKHFFWETDTLGFTFFETEKHMLNAIGTISYDQTFFSDWGAGNFSIESGNSGVGRVSSNFQINSQNDAGQTGTLPDDFLNLNTNNGIDVDGPAAEEELAAIDLDTLHERDLAGLVGLEYSFDMRGVKLWLQALQDVTAVHDGQQIRMALSTYLSKNRNNLELTLGAEWKDDKTLDYYFGVRPEEVEDSRHAHIVDADTSYYFKSDWRYHLAKKWELRWVVLHRWLGDEIKNSPIVDDDTVVVTFFGGVYHF